MDIYYKIGTKYTASKKGWYSIEKGIHVYHKDDIVHNHASCIQFFNRMLRSMHKTIHWLRNLALSPQSDLWRKAEAQLLPARLVPPPPKMATAVAIAVETGLGTAVPTKITARNISPTVTPTCNPVSLKSPMIAPTNGPINIRWRLCLCCMCIIKCNCHVVDKKCLKNKS